jgi:hypothetical protein
MVSADNLPFDVLPLIFQFLSSGSDLVSVVLVSKSFSSGVLPLIYATVTVRLNLVKRLAGVSIQILKNTMINITHSLLDSVTLSNVARKHRLETIRSCRGNPFSSTRPTIA